jgi:hypothetical protein
MPIKGKSPAKIRQMARGAFASGHPKAGKTMMREARAKARTRK